jgi:hypothetical protein
MMIEGLKVVEIVMKVVGFFMERNLMLMLIT